MFRISPGDMINPQQLTATVAGPEGANTLLIFDGQFRSQLLAQNSAFGVPIKETFSVLLGPQLARRQFIRATAVASISQFSFIVNNAPVTSGVWSIDSVDADWDDESGQVELRVDVSVAANVNTSASTFMYAYHVTALAEM